MELCLWKAEEKKCQPRITDPVKIRSSGNKTRAIFSHKKDKKIYYLYLLTKRCTKGYTSTKREMNAEGNHGNTGN